MYWVPLSLNFLLPNTRAAVPLAIWSDSTLAVACLSTSLRVNVLNLIKLDVPIDSSLLLNHCDVSSTNEFKCA
ncbi:hypothetical protein AB3S75_028581 [Citrus x aurantiifolia]